MGEDHDENDDDQDQDNVEDDHDDGEDCDDDGDEDDDRDEDGQGGVMGDHLAAAPRANCCGAGDSLLIFFSKIIIS